MGFFALRSPTRIVSVGVSRRMSRSDGFRMFLGLLYMALRLRSIPFILMLTVVFSINLVLI